MLIDWITMRIDEKYIPREQWLRIRALGDRISRFKSSTGELVYETHAWDTIRSDSHQISMRLGSDAFWIQGSPARITGDGCAVFGSGASSKLDLRRCVEAMRQFVSTNINEILPNSTKWKVSRIDVTSNYVLPSLPHVREALSILRDCEGGRYRVSQQAGDTVYWSHNSRLRKGKAYAKGPHLSYLMKKRTYEGKQYTDEEIQLANQILRLELTIGSQYLREKINKPYYEITPDELKKYHSEYFKRMLGNADMTDDTKIKQAIFRTAETLNSARSAYGLYTLIQTVGWDKAKECTSKTTFYRHLHTLRQAGLGDADINSKKTVSLINREMLVIKEVNSWHELRQHAA